MERRSQQPSQTSPGVFRFSGSPSSFKPQWPGGTAGLQVPEGDHFQAGHFPAYGDLGRKRTWLQALLGTGVATSRLQQFNREPAWSHRHLPLPGLSEVASLPSLPSY